MVFINSLLKEMRPRDTYGYKGAKHKPSKTEWVKIDQESSNRLPNLIENLREIGIPITKRVIAKELKLKDASLRNLPKFKRLIKEAKKNA